MDHQIPFNIIYIMRTWVNQGFNNETLSQVTVLSVESRQSPADGHWRLTT